jgi:hypothetical protein
VSLKWLSSEKLPFVQEITKTGNVRSNSAALWEVEYLLIAPEGSVLSARIVYKSLDWRKEFLPRSIYLSLHCTNNIAFYLRLAVSAD